MEILVQMTALKFNSSLTITVSEILRHWRSGFGSFELMRDWALVSYFSTHCFDQGSRCKNCVQFQVTIKSCLHLPHKKKGASKFSWHTQETAFISNSYNLKSCSRFKYLHFKQCKIFLCLATHSKSHASGSHWFNLNHIGIFSDIH